MAFSFSLEGITKSKNVAGLEVIIQPDGSRKVNYTLLSKKKNTVSVSDSKSSIADLASLKSILSNKIPLLVTIQGKGLLHKKVEGNVTGSDGENLQKILPNAKAEDFYVQKVSGVDSYVFISVIRKDSADEILKEIKQQGFEVIVCSLGVFGIKSILPFVEDKSGYYELNLSGCKLVVNNGIIEEYQLSEKGETHSSLRIGGESVSTDMLLSFASAFQYFLPEPSFVSANIPSVKFIKEEFGQKQIFQLAGMAILSFFFVVLLINYFVFDHYWQRKQTLSEKASLNQDALHRLNKLKAEFDEKQLFFECTGLLNGSRTSFYADRISADMPSFIQLGEMNINPAVRKLNDENNISFTQKVINVSGKCSRSAELNEWINMLRKKEFISDVVLLNFSQDKSKESGLFTLEIKIK